MSLNVYHSLNLSKISRFMKMWDYFLQLVMLILRLCGWYQKWSFKFPFVVLRVESYATSRDC